MKNSRRLSPTKENLTDISPKKKPIFKELLYELLNFISNKGISLPPQLQKKLSQTQIRDIAIQLKPINNLNEQQQLKRLRIKVSDIEFQRKKIQQDLAQFKLISRQQKEKQLRKWQQTYNNLKQSFENSSESSTFRIQQLKENAQKELLVLKSKLQAEYKQQKEFLVTTHQNKIKNTINLMQRQLKQQVQAKQNIIKEMEANNKKIMGQITKRHEQELKQTSLRFKNAQQNRDKQAESRYIAVVSQKKTEQKLHTQTKLQFTKMKEKLLNEIYYEKKSKNELEDQIVKKDQEIRTHLRKIQDLELTIHLNSQKYQKKIKEFKQNVEEQKSKVNQAHTKAFRLLKMKHVQQISSIQQRIKKIQQIHQNRQRMWEDQNQRLRKNFDERPSKKEDLQQIEKLNLRINRKDEEIKQLNKQLKCHILELQNKQDTYNRIFTAGTRMERRSLNKEEKQSKESLTRKSQTSDFKFLLKVYNKQI